MCDKFPILLMILNLFVSPTHQRKAKSKHKHWKWKAWSDLYQSWIIDVFLRGRAPKMVLKTTLLFSAYLLLGNINDTCWKFLQRFRLVCTKETVESWIGQFSKQLKSDNSVLFYVAAVFWRGK